MCGSEDIAVRLATPADADRIGQLLHDFNREFDEPTPGAARLAERVRQLLANGEITALVAGSEPRGVAVLHFRPSLSTDALECYVSELYVVPPRRRQGLGRALMDAAVELARGRGADQMDLATSEDNAPARRLYESAGFSNREGSANSPVMYFYEREL
jgi:ribosomal protein S18 acetylase RimI-like enzyme